MSPDWSPPALAAVLLGGAAWAVWLAAAPPRGRAPVRSALRLGAAALLLAALLDAGCRGSGREGRLLVVLLDRSLSMEVPAGGGVTRAGAARSWLEGEEFERWSAGWRVDIDSFGGATSDPGAAVEAAAAELPDAILLVSDGRAAGGRGVEATPVPLYARLPGPTTVADASLLELRVEEDGPATAVVEVAAVGGLATGDRRVVVTVDGRVAGRAESGPMAAGERRTMRIPLPGPGAGERVVRASLEPADDVPENDARARVWSPAEPARRALVLGLRPGWEYGAWRRVLAEAHPGPVDAYWTVGRGGLRPADGGAPRPWSALESPAYRLVVVVGDPAAAGPEGAEWLGRFAGTEGRGVAWFPEGSAGRLAGSGIAVPGSDGVEGRPALAPPAARWLAGLGVPAEGAPDGGPEWPPVEALPARPAEIPASAVPLFTARGRPIAWVEERAGTRMAVALGTGWYRWPLAGEGPAAFWEAWSAALVRWLAAAEPAGRPLVRLPEGGRMPRGEPIRLELLGEPGGPVVWRIEGEDGVAAEGELGSSESREIRAVPLAPGEYALEARAPGGRRTHARLVVETWAPDLAWTAADTAGVARAAAASGGSLLGSDPPAPLDPSPAARQSIPGPRRGFGTSPWGYLLAAGLVLADWALAGRRRPRA